MGPGVELKEELSELDQKKTAVGEFRLRRACGFRVLVLRSMQPSSVSVTCDSGVEQRPPYFFGASALAMQKVRLTKAPFGDVALPC